MRIKNKDNKLEIFSDEPNGFSFKVNNIVTSVKWMEIEMLIAYKADLFTTDEIRMDIFYNDWKLTITEETPGWEKFIIKTKTIFPGIPVDWDLKIVQPPFAANEVTLYQKTHHKIFADFNNADALGRVRLNTNGSLIDIHKVGENFKENIFILLDDEDSLQIFGRIKYSDEEKIWVAEIDWDNFIKK